MGRHNHNYVTFERTDNYNLIFYFNAIVFTIGLLSCSYFLVESKNKSMKQILTRENNLVAILENYQTADGSVKVPEVLQKYVGFKEIKK